MTVDGERFQVELEGLPSQPPTGRRRGQPQAQGTAALQPQGTSVQTALSDKIIHSPMPGRVISILVRPGEQVSVGQELCVVEAMKMEQSIRAPVAGVVKVVYVQPMDSVTTNAPLVELE